MSIKSIKTGWTGISALAGNDQWFSDFESISSITLGSSQATVEFASIPTTYQHLQLRVMSKHATASSATEVALMQFNSTSMTKGHYLYGSGTSAAAGIPANGAVMNIPGGNFAGTFGAAIIDILDYANTNKNKTFRSLNGTETNSGGEMVFYSGFYGTTTAVTNIKFTIAGGHSFAQHSHFALYGIRG